MPYSMDETDQKIIALLQEDGRMTSVEIARRIGAAEGTVRYRIERLLSRGLIRIYAGIAPPKLGYQDRVMIGLQVRWDKVAEVAHTLGRMPQVRWAVTTLGPYSIIAEALFVANGDLSRFFTHDLAAIPGIEHVHTFHVLEDIKDEWDWRMPTLESEGNEMDQHHKILVVDDDPLFVKSVQLVLESADYQVTSAKSGDEALSLMRADRPDLVLLDVMMDSILDGVYVSRTMAEDPELKDVPIVMVSSIASTEYAAQFPMDEPLNAVYFISKPVQPSHLLASVRRFLT